MIKRFKFFFKVVYKSIFELSYYKEVLKTRFSFSLKYFALLLFLVSFLGSLIFAVKILPIYRFIPGFQSNVIKVARNLYPEELVISSINGRLKTNVKEPYFIEVPSEIKNPFYGGDLITGYDHLITIDTKAGAEDYAKYKSVFLVTDNLLVAPSDKDSSKLSSNKFSQYRVYNLEEIFNLSQKEGVVLNNDLFQKVIDVMVRYLSYLPALFWIGLVILVFVLPLVVTLFLLGWRLLYVLVFSAIFFVITLLMKRKISFTNIFKLSLHGLTLPVLTAFFLGIFVISFPFWLYTALFVLFMLRVFLSLKTAKV